VSEQVTPVPDQNGCNLQVVTGSPVNTTSQGQFSDKYGNTTGAPNPIPACASLPSCKSKFTQRYTIAGYPFTHQLTYGCADVQISRP
jgi:hypothetical protein